MGQPYLVRRHSFWKFDLHLNLHPQIPLFTNLYCNRTICHKFVLPYYIRHFGFKNFGISTLDLKSAPQKAPKTRNEKIRITRNNNYIDIIIITFLTKKCIYEVTNVNLNKKLQFKSRFIIRRINLLAVNRIERNYLVNYSPLKFALRGRGSFEKITRF